MVFLLELCLRPSLRQRRKRICRSDAGKDGERRYTLCTNNSATRKGQKFEFDTKTKAKLPIRVIDDWYGNVRSNVINHTEVDSSLELVDKAWSLVRCD